MVERLRGEKTVGVKQTVKAIKSQKAAAIYVAKDADEKLTQPAINLAQESSLEIVYIDTMKELGKLCGIDVGAAMAAILK